MAEQQPATINFHTAFVYFNDPIVYFDTTFVH